MHIREFQDADTPALLALWGEVFPYDTPHNEPSLSLRRKRAEGDGLILVAEDGGTLAGAVMGGYDGHRGWVYSLAVAPGARRRGVGTALVRGLEALLRGRGCLKLNLQVRADNAAVVAFYESLGFAVEPRVSLGKVLYE